VRQSPYEDHDDWYRLMLSALKLRRRAAINRPPAEIMEDLQLAHPIAGHACDGWDVGPIWPLSPDHARDCDLYEAPGTHG
jgi:hypothetical protein